MGIDGGNNAADVLRSVQKLVDRAESTVDAKEVTQQLKDAYWKLSNEWCESRSSASTVRAAWREALELLNCFLAQLVSPVALEMHSTMKGFKLVFNLLLCALDGKRASVLSLGDVQDGLLTLLSMSASTELSTADDGERAILSINAVCARILESANANATVSSLPTLLIAARAEKESVESAPLLQTLVCRCMGRAAKLLYHRRIGPLEPLLDANDDASSDFDAALFASEAHALLTEGDNNEQSAPLKALCQAVGNVLDAAAVEHAVADLPQDSSVVCIMKGANDELMQENAKLGSPRIDVDLGPVSTDFVASPVSTAQSPMPRQQQAAASPSTPTRVGLLTEEQNLQNIFKQIASADPNEHRSGLDNLHTYLQKNPQETVDSYLAQCARSFKSHIYHALKERDEQQANSPIQTRSKVYVPAPTPPQPRLHSNEAYAAR